MADVGSDGKDRDVVKGARVVETRNIVDGFAPVVRTRWAVTGPDPPWLMRIRVLDSLDSTNKRNFTTSRNAHVRFKTICCRAN